MCGIFAILNNTNTFSSSFIQTEFEEKNTRGTISSKLVQTGTKCFMGSHHFPNEPLQPYEDQNIFLLFDGEIYNADKLYHYIEEPFDETKPSYYCIPFLYCKYGMEHTLRIIDGIFSFLLIDNRSQNPESVLYVVRDHYGQKPLYVLHSDDPPSDIRNDSVLLFSSELKTLSSFHDVLQEKSSLNKQAEVSYQVDLFPPGTYSQYSISSKVFSSWELKHKYKPFYCRNPCFHIYSKIHRFTEDEIAKNIEKYISNSVEKMCIAYHSQPMACLLSGGVDSPIIAALVNQYCIRNGLPQLETYTIGFEDSDEFKYARKIAEQLKTNHTEVVMTEEDVIRCIPEVIPIVETYDLATVRASIPNYLLGKFISENSKAKVVFNGDGADEIFGGYLYLYAAENSIEFDREINQLLEEYHLYDGLRSERTMVVHGLEPRSPYMDTALIQYYLSLPPQVRFHRCNDHCDKYYLRLAFTEKYHTDSIQGTTIPRNILWKMKEEWADSMDSEQHSLIRVIDDYAFDQFFNGLDKENSNRFIQTCFDGSNMAENRELQIKMFEEIVRIDPVFRGCKDHLIPHTMEQYLYRKEFEKHFPGLGQILPHYWMPKYLQDITDPSARRLSIYPDVDADGDED